MTHLENCLKETKFFGTDNISLADMSILGTIGFLFVRALIKFFSSKEKSFPRKFAKAMTSNSYLSAPRRVFQKVPEASGLVRKSQGAQRLVGEWFRRAKLRSAIPEVLGRTGIMRKSPNCLSHLPVFCKRLINRFPPQFVSLRVLNLKMITSAPPNVYYFFMRTHFGSHLSTELIKHWIARRKAISDFHFRTRPIGWTWIN